MPLNPPPPSHAHASGPDAHADEQAFDAFAKAQDPLDIDAATWVARRCNGLSPEGEAELQAWLNADPRHAEAFADMDATFGDVKQLPDGDVAALKASLQHAPVVPPRHATTLAKPAHPGRRQAWLDWGQMLPHAAAATLAFVMVSIGWMSWQLWRQMPTFEKTFTSARGQQLTAILPDGGADTAHTTASLGSTLQLDTATRLQARLYRDRREVHLSDGQAMFNIRPDDERPFHVWAGALRITVIGTRFSVRHTSSGIGAGKTIVFVEEGRVRVATAGPADDNNDLSATPSPDAPAVELTAGQRLVADTTGHLDAVTSLPTASVAPWRDGRVSFEQATLAQAIAEFERYGRTGLLVRDPAVAALPVGGSYSVQQWQHFVQTLPHMLPVRLVQRGDVTEVVAK